MSDDAAARSGYVPEIDALRGLAILAMVALHCGLLRYGWLGVWQFFVISGFVITLSLTKRNSKADQGHNGFFDFALRRAFRIWPALFVYAALALLAALLANRPVQWMSLLATLTFTTNLYSMANGHDLTPFELSHTWTLAVEEHFYLLFGLAFFLTTGHRRALTLILIAALALAPLSRLIVSDIVNAQSGSEQAFKAVYVFTLCHLDSFAIGALIALYKDRLLQSPALVRWLIGCAVAGAILYLIYAVGDNYARGAQGVDLFRNVISGTLYGGGREVFLYSAVALGAGGVLIAALSGFPAFAAILRIARLQWIGHISYGVYIYHPAVVAMVEAILRPWLGDINPMGSDNVFKNTVLFCLAMPATLVIARFSYKYIERPLVDWSRARETDRRLKRGAELLPQPNT